MSNESVALTPTLDPNVYCQRVWDEIQELLRARGVVLFSRPVFSQERYGNWTIEIEQGVMLSTPLKPGN